MRYNSFLHIFPEQCAKYLHDKFRMHSDLTVRELMVILKHIGIKTVKIHNNGKIYDVFYKREIDGIQDFEFLNNLHQYRRDKQIRDEWDKEPPENYDPELLNMQNASDELLRQDEVYYTNESKQIKYNMKNDSKKALYESIMTSISKQVKKVLNEYGNYADTMSDVEWLNHRYASYGEYFQSVYDPVQNYAWYGLTSENIDQAKEMLSENPGINRFRTVRCSSGYRILCFKYTPEKDTDRQQAIAKATQERLERQRKEQEKYDEEFRNTDLSRFSYTQKDIDKMKQYYNKRSNPERLVASIKDDNKLVARWIAAMIIGWGEAVGEFETAIRDRKILSKAEIAAYKEKFKEQADTDNSNMRLLDDTTKKLATSWVSSSIFKWLEQQPVHVEWLESFTNAKTDGGHEAMRRTGRAWSEGFVVKLTSLNDSTATRTVTFDVITNEGGGLYGYATEFSGTITLKELKEYFTRIINNL